MKNRNAISHFEIAKARAAAQSIQVRLGMSQLEMTYVWEDASS